jgi:predicted transcriptional regulator
MRKAITEDVECEERREALRADTLQAWQHYRATGLHATANEVDAWLATWGTDDERPAPACHN